MRSNTKKFIDEFLKISIAGSIISTGLLAPKTTEMIPKKLVKYLSTSSKEQEYKRLVRYMERQKLIETISTPEEVAVRITEKGRRRLVKVELDNLIIPTPKTWDKKWRLVMFDIPKTKQTQRMYFLAKLRMLGFYKLQASFWVYPFPCEEQIHILCENYEIRQFTSIAVCEFHRHESKLLLKEFKYLLAT